MSHLAKTRSTMNDRDLLIAALVASGFQREQIEVHEKPVQLVNYYGRKDSDFKANVVIRREHAPGSIGKADVGFIQEPDGSYSIVLDNMMDVLGGKYGPAWQRGLKEQYMIGKAQRTLERKGLRGDVIRGPGGQLEVRAKVTLRR